MTTEAKEQTQAALLILKLRSAITDKTYAVEMMSAEQSSGMKKYYGKIYEAECEKVAQLTSDLERKINEE